MSMQSPCSLNQYCHLSIGIKKSLKELTVTHKGKQNHPLTAMALNTLLLLGTCEFLCTPQHL